eukprot:403348617
MEYVRKKFLNFQFNSYDQEGQKHSLVGKCRFCGLIYKQSEYILYKDDKIAIFADKKSCGQAHLQCVPIRHIKDISYLQPNQTDIDLLEYMLEKATEYLKLHYHIKQNNNIPSKHDQNIRPAFQPGYVFGFHKPGHNSQFHLHMHMIVLPLLDSSFEKRYYGNGLKKTYEVIEELKLKQLQIEKGILFNQSQYVNGMEIEAPQNHNGSECSNDPTHKCQNCQTAFEDEEVKMQ